MHPNAIWHHVTTYLATSPWHTLTCSQSFQVPILFKRSLRCTTNVQGSPEHSPHPLSSLSSADSAGGIATPSRGSHNEVPKREPTRPQKIHRPSPVLRGVYFQEKPSYTIGCWNDLKSWSMDWFKGKSTGNHGFYHQIDRAFRFQFSHHPVLWHENHARLVPDFLHEVQSQVFHQIGDGMEHQPRSRVTLRRQIHLNLIAFQPLIGYKKWNIFPVDSP